MTSMDCKARSCNSLNAPTDPCQTVALWKNVFVLLKTDLIWVESFLHAHNSRVVFFLFDWCLAQHIAV